MSLRQRLKCHHGLSCKLSAGCILRHAAVNNIIRRVLATINVLAVFEPSGMLGTNGKRPAGMTHGPWSNGRALV